MGTFCHAIEADELKGLLAKLEDEDFNKREKASKDLVASDVSIIELQNLIKENRSPEIKSRLRNVVEAKIEASGWVRIKNGEIPENAKACGKETWGAREYLLYLVKTSLDGNDYIGKYRHEPDSLAHFPIGEKEEIVDEIQIWIGKGKWQTWEKGLKSKIPMGMSKNGKRIYAVRGNINNGTHIGMLIEGESEARISWRGSVTRLEKFEVLVME
jgi:hypothetical protein